MNHHLYRPLLLLGLSLLVSCGVRHAATPPPSTESQPGTPLLERVQERLQAAPTYAPVLRGPLQAELRLGKEQVSTRINATIRRGEVIYWSVVPFPLIEAARVWFTQEGITAIDRMHGRYAEVSYAELSQLLGFPLYYTMVEQLLLGKPFLPAEARGLRGGAFSLTEAADASSEVNALLSVAQGGASGRYLLSWHLTPQLAPTRFSVQKQDAVEKPIFALSYRPAALGELPQETALYLGASSSSSLPALRLDWTKVRPYTGNIPDLTPRIKESYQRMTLPELLKLLSAL